jgi:curli biogenesis system outer membrane secretion channel CsgG
MAQRISAAALVGVVVMLSSAQAVRGAGADPAAPPVVSVIAFDGGRTGWVPPPRLGVTAAELLAEQLVASGSYRVLDSAWLGASPDELTHMALARLSRIADAAHVDYVILGAVTRLSNENKTKNAGGAAMLALSLVLHRPPLIGGWRQSRTDAVLAVTTRMIDVHTGELVSAATGQGVASRTNRSLTGLALASSAGGGGFSQASANARDAMIDEALHAAIDQAGRQLIAAGSRLEGVRAAASEAH